MIKTSSTRIVIDKNHYEQMYWKQKKYICGLDEAGRGPLAGPLVTAAVLVPLETQYELLKDSKSMTPKKREEVFLWIQKNAWYGVGIVPATIIDVVNIWQATLLGMRRAVMQLVSISPHKPHACVVDAMPLSLQGSSYENIPIYSFIEGERLSCSIAAASIVAKVVRDRIMKQLDPLFPRYNFLQHKGYATSLHRARIQEYQQSIAHRMSFLRSIKKSNTKEVNEFCQQQFC